MSEELLLQIDGRLLGLSELLATICAELDKDGSIGLTERARQTVAQARARGPAPQNAEAALARIRQEADAALVLLGQRVEQLRASNPQG